jgi:3-phosphoshikimate 1-carboxyvinyltransferase
MYLIKPPSHLKGSISLPSSKSICNRALIINALSYSPYSIENISDCDDTRMVMDVLESDSTCFNVGAAGTAMRFLTAYLSKIVGEWTITGSERMKKRPIRILVEALNLLGARIEYMEKEGFPPLRIFGSALQGGKIELDGSVSSQYISALLMIAPTMEKGLTIKLKGHLASKSYVLMTLKIMEDFGVKSTWDNGEITILPQEYKPVKFEVEPDWSAASYWYEILALLGEGEILLKGLKKDSCQGDAEVATLFSLLGVQSSYTNEGVLLTAVGKTVPYMAYNFVDQPDLVQTVVVTCCLLNVPFSFTGIETLRIKETDRIAALMAEMAKLGYKLKETAGGALEWNGDKTGIDKNPVVDTYEDHRMAMAFAPAGIKVSGLSIRNPQVVRKSYPRFWNDLQHAGFEIIQQ